MLDLKELKQRYINSNYRNDEKLVQLDHIDFMAFLWQLQTHQFEITPFSNKGFLRYFIIGSKLCIDIINLYFEKRDEIQKFILS